MLTALAEGAAACISRQIVEDGPDRGGIVRPDWGIAEPSGSAGFLGLGGVLYCARHLRPGETPIGPPDAELIPALQRAAEYLRRVQRPSGCIDLRDCNYDSAPDTAFAVQALCPVLELGRRVQGPSTDWTTLITTIAQFVQQACSGMASGGFHTPNHRWVMAAAMAWADRLLPNLDVQSTVASYLAEGYDIDGDGAYIERSAGVYDGICDRSLLILHETLGDEAAYRTARANLRLDLDLLHPDGSIETGLSRRQDRFGRAVPASLALPLLMAHRTEPDPAFEGAAALIWRRTKGDAAGLAWHLLRHDLDGFGADAAAKLPPVTHRYGCSGLWRSRRGEISATAYTGSTRLFSLVYGEAEIAAVRISQSYFGVGQFVADCSTEVAGGIVLRSEGRREVHRPGYELPLGRPVEAETWYERRGERAWRELPRPVSELDIIEMDDGFELVYRTVGGMDDVTAQIALDFPAGGIWETADTALRPEAGQALFLKQGYARMRYGVRAIVIGPGADAHRMWAMRDAEPAPDYVRILLTFVTPVQHRLRIRTVSGPDVERDWCSEPAGPED